MSLWLERASQKSDIKVETRAWSSGGTYLKTLFPQTYFEKRLQKERADLVHRGAAPRHPTLAANFDRH